MTSLRVRYAIECKLTCLGGSERGTCGCRGPSTCAMQNEPGFEQAREEAVRRMIRHVFTNQGWDTKSSDPVQDAQKTVNEALDLFPSSGPKV